MIDADGCISIHKRYVGNCFKISIRCIISNNSKEIISKVKKIVENRCYIIRKKTPTNINYEMRFNHNAIRWLLPQLRLTVRHKEIRRKASISYLKYSKLGINQYSNENRQSKVDKIVKIFKESC